MPVATTGIFILYAVEKQPEYQKTDIRTEE
jgi:hypothetical protein